MRIATIILTASAGLLWSTAAVSGSAQPPMGQFNGAFYTCDQGQAFAVSYDSRSPTGATLTTSNNNTQYHLKRVTGTGQTQFSNGTVNISISGDDATVQGAQVKLTGCKLKNKT